MTKEQKEILTKELKRFYERLFTAQEEELKQRGFTCNDNGTRSLIIDLSDVGDKVKGNVEVIKFTNKHEQGTRGGNNYGKEKQKN